MPCPICDKPTDTKFRPFCSKRCADVDLGDAGDGTSFGVSGLYSFTESFALGLFINTDDDVTGYGLGARFYF